MKSKYIKEEDLEEFNKNLDKILVCAKFLGRDNYYCVNFSFAGNNQLSEDFLDVLGEQVSDEPFNDSFFADRHKFKGLRGVIFDRVIGIKPRLNLSHFII